MFFQATRICFTFWGKTNNNEEDVALGWVNCQLTDYKHELKTGLVALGMWPGEKANPIGTCIANNGSNTGVLYVEFDTYSLPVVFLTEPMKGNIVFRESHNFKILWKSLIENQ